MANETKIFTGMAETTTGDIQASSFRDDASEDENGDEWTQNRQSAAIKKPKQHRQAACYLQPGQIKGQPNRHRPRKQMVVIDIVGEPNRVEDLGHPGVDEDTGDDDV